MSDRDDQPDYRPTPTTRGSMPDWAKAKSDAPPMPDVKAELEKLRRKLFRSSPDQDSEK